MDKKKMIRKFILKSICFVMLIGITLLFANKVLQLKAGMDKFYGFYKEEENFDVLFFGSSRVLNGVEPMELWEDYGIRSYNLAQHSEGIGRNYWQLKNALEHNVPQVAVLDISAFYIHYEIDPSAEDQKGALHKQIDHMPLSLTKLQAIRELCPRGTRLEYIFPFVLYHSRWNEVTKYDFTYSQYSDDRKGAVIKEGLEAQEKPEWDESLRSETYPLEKTNIRRIVELCKEYGTQPVFICMPYVHTPDRVEMFNCMSDLIEELGAPFINYARDGEFVDYEMDFSDFSHLNVAGSLKLTRELGKYFMENYKPLEVTAETKEAWDQALVAYKEGKDRLIMGEEDYISLLLNTYQDDDYEVKVITNEDRMQYTGTAKFFPDMPGTPGYSGYRMEIYHTGESEPFYVWEDAY